MTARLVDVAGLAAMDVAGRLPRLVEGLDEVGCDALLVTNMVDIRYLSGFTGSAGLLLVTPHGHLLVTDGRYGDQAEEEVGAAGAAVAVAVATTASGQGERLATATTGLVHLGLQADHVSWAAQRRWATERFADLELVPTEGEVDELRAVKDDGELARIEAAAAIADLALADVGQVLAEGPTERDFAAALDDRVRDLGADDISFATIVGSGANGARPHATPGDRTIVDGDLVVVDFGALVDGYHSDMTRTFVVGEASPTQRRMLDVVARSQAAGVAAVRDGVACAEVDRACREVIAEAGWGEAFVHGTGHGVGLDIHEAPPVSSASTATLRAGHVVTVEPGVYLPDHGGVRIEDTVVVTADGCRTLTKAPKTAAP